VETLADRVARRLGGWPVTTKRMFGGLTFLLNGNMLCSVSDKGLMARVGAEAEPIALGRPHAAPCLGAGRRMAGFILVDPEGIATDSDLHAWLDMALAYVRGLPPKETKAPRDRKPADRTTRRTR
jgi:TfoX/Sxy family transcriptional regulator of competence genes